MRHEHLIESESNSATPEHRSRMLKSESRKVEQNPGSTPTIISPFTRNSLSECARLSLTFYHTIPATITRTARTSHSFATCRATLTATRVRRPDRGSGHRSVHCLNARANHCTRPSPFTRTPSCSMQSESGHTFRRSCPTANPVPSAASQFIHCIPHSDPLIAYCMGQGRECIHFTCTSESLHPRFLT